MPIRPFDGPIPGENYTSDVRNYPWHRPPEYTDMDSALEYLFKLFRQEEVQDACVSMLEMGLEISTIVDMLVTKGMSKGKWSIDLGILLAGPMAHILVLMAKGYDIEFDLGITPKKSVPTKRFFNEIKKDRNTGKSVLNDENMNKVFMQAQGFMAGLNNFKEFAAKETSTSEAPPPLPPQEMGMM